VAITPRHALDVCGVFGFIDYMGAALNALVARYQTRVEALTDTDARLNASWALETWQGAALAYETAAARGPAQYSISGRSFAFESKEAARQAMVAARADLDDCISSDGGTVFVDFGGSQW